jgi:hypothetical protein
LFWRFRSGAGAVRAALCAKESCNGGQLTNI